MEAKPIEVIMRVDFAASDGNQIVAHAERVQELVRCKNCKYRDEGGFCLGRGYPEQLVPDDGYCDKGDRKEVEYG